jgi:hypothetical protein
MPKIRIPCLSTGGSPNTLGNDRADLLILGGNFSDSEPGIRTKMLYVQ